MQPPPFVPAVADAAGWVAIARRPALAVLLDLDGTLLPFAPTPEEATLDRPAARLLTAMRYARVQIIVVSGRPRALLEPLRASVPGAWWVAEQGTWRCDDDAWTGPPAPAHELDDLARALTSLARVAGANVERKSLSLCLHWRQVAESARGELIRRAEQTCDDWLASHPDHDRQIGAAVLEVRRRGAHKGTAVGWVRDRMPDATLLAIGDDASDLDMFAALDDRDAAIAVGSLSGPCKGPVAHVSGPSSVRDFLWWLVDVRAASMGDATAGPPTRSDVVPIAGPRRLLVVSSRTRPSMVDERQREVGDLASALEPALRAQDGLWLGATGATSAAPRTTLGAEADRPRRVSFDLPVSLYQAFDDGFCNQALWPLFHGFRGRVRYSDADWAAYVEANEAYARLAVDLVDPDATIWVHDYHLLLAARALRRLGHRGPIGHFLHVPFPQRELFETLPWSPELLDAMLEFDLLGFHTARWAANFAAAIAALPDVVHDGDVIYRAGARTAIGVFPLGIDGAAFAPRAGQEIVAPDLLGLQQAIQGCRMVLGVDRLDYAKGIAERLIAFERMLELFPAWRNTVTLVQISVPSRAELPEYAELRDRVENHVGRINGRFGEADWVPVRYLYRSYAHDVLAQLYRLADVALVTPLLDGMNLVAKEFVAAQDPAVPGVLVLSRFAGAADELRDAVLTNPYHADGLAADLDAALRMPLDERRRRHAGLAEAVARVTPASWAQGFLDRLAGVARVSSSRRGFGRPRTVDLIGEAS